MRLSTRMAMAGLGVAVALAATAAPASAAHHLVRISEVYPGAPGSEAAEAVELQLLASGENQVGGGAASVQAYNASGTPVNSGMFVADPPNDESQRTMLVGTSTFGPGVDGTFATDADTMDPAGGSACFVSATGFGVVDCVSWGVAVAPLGSTVGTPAPQIPEGLSLTRSIARACATLHETADDTNDSAADFLHAAPSLRSNDDPVTETPCSAGGGGGGGGGADKNPPNTEITKQPKKRSDRRRIRIEFRSSENGSRFECKLERKPFAACSSPLRKKVRPGRHTFKVRATDAAGNTDPTPATARFRVVRRAADAAVRGRSPSLAGRRPR